MLLAAVSAYQTIRVHVEQIRRSDGVVLVEDHAFDAALFEGRKIDGGQICELT